MQRFGTIKQVDLPSVSRLRSSYAQADFADAFSVDLRESVSRNTEALAQHIFARQPQWIACLLRLRDGLVRPFGLKTTADLHAEGGDRINIFQVLERYDDEIILGENDKHLNFRVSVLQQPASQRQLRRLTVTTLVFYNRPLGRVYIALIAPFHRAVVQSSLDRAQKLGWPAR